jgi:hypothetical protein
VVIPICFKEFLKQIISEILDFKNYVYYKKRSEEENPSVAAEHSGLSR